MILVDTSVWISHLRSDDPPLRELLLGGDVVCHPFVIGELGSGNLKNRIEVISLLQALPMAKVAENDEILQFIEIHNLMGTGIGLIDIHLLAAALLSKTPL
ncbi:MAG: PIN domain-containing protein [Chloroflexota bacterium]|nr:PIN domain-containing protein [Chloroflexota bacterium]